MSDLLNQASLVMVPSGYKEDTVYSVVPTDGSGDLAFTRASNGTRINSAGLVEVVAWNLVQQSENIGTSPWLTNGATLTSGQTDPSGGTTAVKIQLASGGNNYVYQGITIPQGTNIVSAYLRADSATTIGFSMGGSTPNSVNLTTTWQLFTFSSADTSGGIIFDNYFGPSPTQQAKTFYIWHPQFNIGSTAKPYFPTTDRLNVPRLTYQNGGGGCPSLLLEKQSTNVLTQSNVLTGVSGTTATANDGISPDGTQNAILISGTSGYAYAGTSNNFGGGVTSTFSAFIKYKQGVGQASIGIGGQFAAYLYIDGLDDGNIVLTNYAGSGVSGVTTGYEVHANGWYRFWLTATYTGTAGYQEWQIASNTTNTHLWYYGGQNEASSYMTSFIFTSGTSATRVADLASVPQGTIANFGSNPFCVFLDINFAKLSSTGAIALLGNRQSGNWWRIYSNGTEFRIEVSGSNGFGTDIFLNVGEITTRTKIAVNRNGNDIKIYVNGSVAFSQTNAVWSSDFTTGNSQVDFNSWNSGAYEITTTEYNEVVLFKQSLSTTELASLTTI